MDLYIPAKTLDDYERTAQRYIDNRKKPDIGVYGAVPVSPELLMCLIRFYRARAAQPSAGE